MMLHMLSIISNIPLLVWPLFVILLVGGLKARQTNVVPLVPLLLIPSLFFSWSIFSFFDNYAVDLLTMGLWSLCLGAGFLLGFAHIQRLNLQFDKKNRAWKCRVAGFH